MARDDSWPTTMPIMVVFSFSFSEALHTTMNTMYTMKQAVPVECLDWCLVSRVTISFMAYLAVSLYEILRIINRQF